MIRWALRTGHPICSSIAVLSLFSCSGAAGTTTAPRLEISDFEPSFREDFDSVDISEWGCLSKWIAHTPWAGDFGSARFIAPGEKFPFVTKDGILRIEARKLGDGSWASGMLSSWSACNSGYAQKYGYFETRARLPAAPGFWPSFWLIGVDKRQGTAEIDVFEFLTHNPDEFSLGIHKHPRNGSETRQSFTTKHSVDVGMLSEKFNTYGVEVSQDDIVFYLNREEIFRTPNLEEMRQPMYMLLSFPADTSRMDETTPNSVFMEVDYIHAFQRKPIGL
jgi:beta-glucanase (GH16 family)